MRACVGIHDRVLRSSCFPRFAAQQTLEPPDKRAHDVAYLQCAQHHARCLFFVFLRVLQEIVDEAPGVVDEIAAQHEADIRVSSVRRISVTHSARCWGAACGGGGGGTHAALNCATVKASSYVMPPTM